MVASPCLAFLLAAACLTPRNSGFGTHEELGLPGCSFLARTGLPCPSCGLTTSVAATVHGRIGLAFRAQPFGVFLAAAVAAVGMAGVAELVTGRDVLRLLGPRPWWIIAAAGGMLAGWAWKLAVGLATGQLPLR